VTDFLGSIIPEVRRDVRSPEYLDGLPAGGTRPRVSLARSIQNAPADGAILIEYKRVSPGAEDPALPSSTAAEFVDRFSSALVAGYSCIGTRPVFAGSPRTCRSIAERTDRPVLFKDFVIDPVQIEAADRAGCSAILLIARLATRGLLDHSLAELAREAHARRLEVLLEIHDPSEVRLATGVPADILGVNLRNLETLRLAPEIATSTTRILRSKLPRLGLSGVTGPSEARRWWELDMDGILVGTAAARAPDPDAFLRGLRRPSSVEALP
jgi:indole-3-glycerol phosphate synthase